MGSKVYAPLPFSYLTGGNAPEKPYGFKKSESHDEGAERPATENQEPYSIFPGASQPGGKPRVSNRESMDIIDPKLDVTDPYLLSTGTLTNSKTEGERNSYNDDPRYRNTIPSDTDGGNVFFRPSSGSESTSPPPVSPGKTVASHAPRPEQGQTNPAIASITQDEDSQGKKLPRYKVGESAVYQYYTGSGQSQDQDPQNRTEAAPDKANPIWDKYYAQAQPSPGYNAASYPPNSPNSPPTPGIRPTTKEDDFNTLLRNSSSSDSRGGACCRSCTKPCAVLLAVIFSAIIFLGVGFAVGWFVHDAVQTSDVGSVTTVATSIATGPTTEAALVITTAPTPAPTPTTTTTTTTMPPPTPAPPTPAPPTSAPPTPAPITPDPTTPDPTTPDPTTTATPTSEPPTTPSP